MFSRVLGFIVANFVVVGSFRPKGTYTRKNANNTMLTTAHVEPDLWLDATSLMLTSKLIPREVEPEYQILQMTLKESFKS